MATFSKLAVAKAAMKKYNETFDSHFTLQMMDFPNTFLEDSITVTEPVEIKMRVKNPKNRDHFVGDEVRMVLEKNGNFELQINLTGSNAGHSKLHLKGKIALKERIFG